MAFKEDLHKIVLDGGISDKDALELRGRMEEWARSYCTSQVGNTYEHFVKEWNVDVEKLWMTAMDDTLLNNILDQATSLEELLEVIRKREEYVYKKMKTIGDTTKLVSLVVLRNSIQFWNDAYCNPSNPWHEIIYYMPLQTKTKGKVRDKFNKWVQEKVIPYINRTVAALVVGAASDYATALVAVPITAAIDGDVGGVVGGTLTMLGSVGGAIGGWSGASYLNDQP